MVVRDESWWDATTPDTPLKDTEWDYDPYGRKITRTDYDDTGAIVARTRYVYDGWQLVREIDATTETVLAEYVHGPGYVDDIIQSRRAGQVYYHHTDQQYSTTALTDASGAVAEYYQYDAFGAPLFFDDTGAPLTASAVNNPVLYTGRPWDADLALYDSATVGLNGFAVKKIDKRHSERGIPVALSWRLQAMRFTLANAAGMPRPLWLSITAFSPTEFFTWQGN